MALQGDILRVTLLGERGAVDDIQNVFQFRIVSPASITDADVLDDLLELANAIVQIIRLIITASTIWRGIRVENLTTSTLLGEATFASPIGGSLAGDGGVQQVTAPVSFKTVVPRVILRKDIGPLGEGVLDVAGRLSSTATDALDDFVTLMLADYSASTGVYEYGYDSPKTSQWETPTEGFYTTAPGVRRSRRFGKGS